MVVHCCHITTGRWRHQLFAHKNKTKTLHKKHPVFVAKSPMNAAYGKESANNWLYWLVTPPSPPYSHPPFHTLSPHIHSSFPNEHTSQQIQVCVCYFDGALLVIISDLQDIPTTRWWQSIERIDTTPCTCDVDRYLSPFFCRLECTAKGTARSYVRVFGLPWSITHIMVVS